MPETTNNAAALAELGDTFTFAQATAAGMTKHALYKLRDAGAIEAIARGIYRRTDGELADHSLIAIATAAHSATLCLSTALARHGLSDDIPAAPDIALPRGTRTPAIHAPVRWHHFAADTFDLGRGVLAVDSATSIGIYCAERSIIDAFRTRGREGHELGHEALRRWLRRRGSHPAELLDLARHWPRTLTPLRTALDVLL
jgi:predicted transcriptional regulator of viral defense system